MIRYEHKHTYVYQFELQKHKSHSYGFQKCEYTLLTNITDPNCKANRQLLESMLRTVYGHMPKGVKFSYEKVK
jgi:hypothetical protein